MSERIIELLESIELLLTNLREGVDQTQLALLAPRKYRVCWYNPHSSTPSQRIVPAYTAADAVTQVMLTFEGSYPKPSRVHHVEPFDSENPEGG